MVPLLVGLAFTAQAAVVSYVPDVGTRFWSVFTPGLVCAVSVWFVWGRGYQKELKKISPRDLPAPGEKAGPKEKMTISVIATGTPGAADGGINDFLQRMAVLDQMLLMLNRYGPGTPANYGGMVAALELEKNRTGVLETERDQLRGQLTTLKALAEKRVEVKALEERVKNPQPTAKASPGFPRCVFDSEGKRRRKTCDLCGSTGRYTVRVENAVLAKGEAPQTLNVCTGRTDKLSPCEREVAALSETAPADGASNTTTEAMTAST